MYIYNVTLSIDSDIHEEWLQWMKQVHIPDVMSTGLFTENKICKVMAEGDSGVTYSVQYIFTEMEHYTSYQQKHAPALQKAHSDKYKDKCVAFRTLLEIV